MNSRYIFCSTDNNGCQIIQFDGFIDLDAYDTIAMRLRGDGRCYISTVSLAHHDKKDFSSLLFNLLSTYINLNCPFVAFFICFFGIDIHGELG